MNTTANFGEGQIISFDYNLIRIEKSKREEF